MTPKANSHIPLLFVTANHEDYAGLSGILTDASVDPESQWKPQSCGSTRAALRLIRNTCIPILLCEHRAGDGSWKDLLEQSAELPGAPCVIVTSRTADEQLWSEALNLGAYDVLAMPFDPSEVARVLRMAWCHWKNRTGRNVATEQPALAISAAR